MYRLHLFLTSCSYLFLHLWTHHAVLIHLIHLLCSTVFHFTHSSTGLHITKRPETHTSITSGSHNVGWNIGRAVERGVGFGREKEWGNAMVVDGAVCIDQATAGVGICEEVLAMNGMVFNINAIYHARFILHHFNNRRQHSLSLYQWSPTFKEIFSKVTGNTGTSPCFWSFTIKERSQVASSRFHWWIRLLPEVVQTEGVSIGL